MKLSKTYENGTLYLIGYQTDKDVLELLHECFTSLEDAINYCEQNISYIGYTALYVITASKDGMEVLLKVYFPETKLTKEIIRANLEA